MSDHANHQIRGSRALNEAFDLIAASVMDDHAAVQVLVAASPCLPCLAVALAAAAVGLASGAGDFDGNGPTPEFARRVFTLLDAHRSAIAAREHRT